jgi:5-(carboxyamino)imidazole ribonucleotide mutase
MIDTFAGIIMGSESDRGTMQGAADILREFHIPFEWRVISAHRSPELLQEFVHDAEKRGISFFIAGAGGSAHLAGVIASFTTLPVLGVPIHNTKLLGLDSLLSIVNMPAGIPVATFSVGPAGATNAALFGVALLAAKYPEVNSILRNYRNQKKERLTADSIKNAVVYDGKEV